MNVMLLSVGGTPAPLIKAIQDKQPEKIIFFVSPGSRSQVFTEIVPSLKYNPEYCFLVTKDPQNIGTCTFSLLQEMPKELEDLGCGNLEWPNLVGYTGGTKTMSAAVVWASSRFPCEYIYVGGKQDARTKDGLGVVQDGHEEIVHLQNPWNQVAYYDLHDAIELFDSGQYGNATAMLKQLVKRIDDPRSQRTLNSLQFVFEGYHAWDCFDHKRAQGLFKAHTPLLMDTAEKEEAFLPGLKQFAAATEELQEILKGIKPGRISNNMIWDLLSNAVRRADLEQKYEDACARCYAAMEKAAKHALSRDYAINNNAAQPEQIPDSLRKEYVSRYMFEFAENDGSITKKLRFGFAASYRLLNELDHRLGKRFKAREKEIMKHIEARNHSILGHGIEPATQNHFNCLLEDALYLLGKEPDDLVAFPSFK